VIGVSKIICDHCAVAENIHTLPTEGIGISWHGRGGGGVENEKIFHSF